MITRFPEVGEYLMRDVGMYSSYIGRRFIVQILEHIGHTEYKVKMIWSEDGDDLGKFRNSFFVPLDETAETDTILTEDEVMALMI